MQSRPLRLDVLGTPTCEDSLPWHRSSRPVERVPASVRVTSRRSAPVASEETTSTERAGSVQERNHSHRTKPRGILSFLPLLSLVSWRLISASVYCTCKVDTSL